MVHAVFEQVAFQEITFRQISVSPMDVLDDAFRAALTICNRDENDPHFQQFKTGITNIKPHLFHRFMIEDAIVAAAKVMYLTRLLRKGQAGPPERFENAQAVAAWEIPTTDYNRFNRLRKTNPEAFFHIFKVYELLQILNSPYDYPHQH